MKNKRAWLKAGLLLFGILAGILFVEVALRWIPDSPGYDPGILEEGLLQYDDRLGWVHASNWTGTHTHPDFQVRYQTDANGFREPGPELSGFPTLVLGDSFTFGIGVKNRETFCSLLSQSLESRRFLNAGIIGYSTDQEVLLLEKILAVRPYPKMLLVVYLGNDLMDNQRSVPAQAARSKPYFSRSENGDLILRNVPVPTSNPSPVDPGAYTRTILSGTYQPSPWDRLLRKSSITRRWVQFRRNQGIYPELRLEGAYESQLSLFQSLVDRAHQSQKEFTLVLIGGRSYVENPNSFSAQYQESLRSGILEIAFPENITVIDAARPMREAFAKQPSQGLFHPREGHFNPQGHQWLADFLGEQL